MTDVYNKNLSLFVAWLNILVSIALPIYGFVNHWVAHMDDAPEYFHSGLTRVIIMSVSVIPWLIASILLVMGIKQNRPKLMASWVYLGYLLVFLGLGTMIYVACNIIMWTGNLKRTLVEILPMIICWAIFTLCIRPVRKLYQKMSIPPPVEPTQVVMASQKPMEVGPRYMPIFENV